MTRDQHISGEECGKHAAGTYITDICMNRRDLQRRVLVACISPSRWRRRAVIDVLCIKAAHIFLTSTVTDAYRVSCFRLALLL